MLYHNLFRLCVRPLKLQKYKPSNKLARRLARPCRTRHFLARLLARILQIRHSTCKNLAKKTLNLQESSKEDRIFICKNFSRDHYNPGLMNVNVHGGRKASSLRFLSRMVDSLVCSKLMLCETNNMKSNKDCTFTLR